MKPKSPGSKSPLCNPRSANLFRACRCKRKWPAAEAFYLAKRWRDASAEFAGLLPKLSGVDRQRADLRIVQCEVQLGGKLDQLVEIQLTDPDLDAERIFSVAQAHRGLKLEAAVTRGC